MGPLQQNLPLLEGAGILEFGFENGINCLDTAELYQTYPYIKLALKSKPDAVVITKCYAYDAATAKSSFRAAVEGIGREYIDVFMLHEQESAHTIRGHYEAIEYFLKRREEGAIGALGLSTHHVAGVLGANRYPELSVIFPLVNLTGIGIADGNRDDMEQATMQAHALGKGVIAMKPFGGGHLLSRREEAIQYMRGLPYVHTIAVGMQTKAEVLYNVAAFVGKTPPEEAAAGISLQPRRLMIHDWCEGCGKCALRCKSGALRLEGGVAVVDNEKCVRCGYCASACPQFCIKVV
jgi:predicted aldo/keto reductase-like oxidoreductase